MGVKINRGSMSDSHAYQQRGHSVILVTLYTI